MHVSTAAVAEDVVQETWTVLVGKLASSAGGEPAAEDEPAVDPPASSRAARGPRRWDDETPEKLMLRGELLRSSRSRHKSDNRGSATSTQPPP